MASTMSVSTGHLDSPADRFMHRLLRIHTSTSSAGSQTVASAQRAMSTSIVISAIRCLLTYLVIPLAGPTVQVIGSVGRPLAAALCILGVYSSIRSMRRFWSAGHRYRWHYTIFAAVIVTYLTISLVVDAVSLFA